MSLHLERRHSIREPIVRPAKVFDDRGRRFLAGLTLNASSGGVLLTIKGGVDLPEGAPVHYAVAWTDQQNVINHEQMSPATVVRTEGGHAGATVIALANNERPPIRRAA